MTPPTRPPEPPAEILVLVAAGGAGWETTALEHLARGGPAVRLARRCVDLTDLLATASTGMASAAVVSAVMPGLDADSVAALTRAGVGVVVVAEPGDLLDGDAERMRRIGVDHLLVGSELGSLVETLVSARGPEAALRARVASDAVLDGVLDAALEADGSRTGCVLVVWGPAGAPGRTTVAVGLAAELAGTGADVLLLDADPYGGTVAQHLGVLDEASGLLAAARAANAGRLDADRLAGLTRGVGEHLRVLTGLPRPDRWREVRTTAFDDLLDEAARAAAYVVVDVGFSLESDPLDPFGSTAPQRNQMTLTALGRADGVVVVGSADPVGLARLARGLVELHELDPSLHPRVVVNRTRATLGWADREIQGMVEGFVSPTSVHFLPEDRPAADRALMAGRSLAESGESALRTALQGLAHAVAGHAPPPSRRFGIRRRRAG